MLPLLYRLSALARFARLALALLTAALVLLSCARPVPPVAPSYAPRTSLAASSPAAAVALPPTGTPTPLPSATAIPVHTATRTASPPTATASPAPSSTCTALPPTATSSPTRPLPSPTPWPESRLDTLSRFGVSVINREHRTYYLTTVPLGWYLSYNLELTPDRPYRMRVGSALPDRVEFFQMVPIEPELFPPNWDVLAEAIRLNPGSIWIVGNEPESIYKGLRTPEQYARVYHEYYAFIKLRDPSALLMIGGIVQPSPLRLQWLDRVLASYRQSYGVPMRVDIWNIHNTTLREKKGEYGADIPLGLSATAGELPTWQQVDDLELFQQHVVAMRRWMAEHGERHKPLIISEYGFLYPSSMFDPLGEPGGDERLKIFMASTFEYLLDARDPQLGYPADDNRLVQRWAWYSLNGWRFEEDEIDGFNGELFRYGTRDITPFGRHYSELVTDILERE